MSKFCQKPSLLINAIGREAAGALAGDQGQAIARVYDDINALRESVADVRTVVNGRMGDIQRATLVGLAREASDCGVICFCLVGCLVDSPPARPK